MPFQSKNTPGNPYICFVQNQQYLTSPVPEAPSSLVNDHSATQPSAPQHIKVRERVHGQRVPAPSLTPRISETQSTAHPRQGPQLLQQNPEGWISSYALWRSPYSTNSVLLDIEILAGLTAPEPHTETGENRGPYVLGRGHVITRLQYGSYRAGSEGQRVLGQGL